MADEISLDDIPQEIKDLANHLGVDVEDVLKTVSAKIEAGETPTAAAVAASTAPTTTATVPTVSAQITDVPAVTGVATPAPTVETADGVTVVPTPTQQELLEQQVAVLTQENQQIKKLAQTASEGRVVGSGGLSGPTQEDIPTLSGIDPGIRWAVRNGLLDVEKLAPKIAALFKADLGGAI